MNDELIGDVMDKRSVKNALRRLGRQTFNAKGSDVQALFVELNGVSDRAAAIIIGTLVETALRSAISGKLRNLSPSDEDRMFDGGGLGPLSTFDSKILLGYAINAITDVQRHDLEYVKAIRNAFAHSPAGLSFENQVICAACMQLQSVGLIKTPPHYRQTARWRFMASCVVMMYQLSEQFSNVRLGPIRIADLIASDPHGGKN